MFGGLLVSPKQVQNTVLRTSANFFIKKSVPANSLREDSKEAVCRRMRRLVAFLYLAAQNFKLFSKIKNQNIKI
jgi:hypothetical protein